MELRGIVVERTDDLLRLQKDLLDAVAPFVETSGTAAAFVSTEDGRDIQPGLIDYVTRFTAIAAGERFNPHFTIGVASESFLNEMMAEPFRAFAFSPAGASVYQLGVSGILCAGPGFHQVLTKRSSNMMANWVFASAHSRGGIFHSLAT